MLTITTGREPREFHAYEANYQVGCSGIFMMGVTCSFRVSFWMACWLLLGRCADRIWYVWSGETFV
jgi:hypothetical protein